MVFKRAAKESFSIKPQNKKFINNINSNTFTIEVKGGLISF